MDPSVLWQQVYRCNNLYYIDLGGTFGSRNAGDSWNLVMELIIASMRRWCKLDQLHYYVDNAISCSAPINESPNYSEATRAYDSIIKFLTIANVPFHDVQKPSTSIKFLGWFVDTVAMTVAITPERLKWVKDVIKSTDVSINSKFIRSVTGVLEFLASALPFLRAPLGWLQKRSTAIVNGSEQCSQDFKIRFKKYMRYVQSLLGDWNGRALIRDTNKAVSDPDMCIYADASGEIGYVLSKILQSNMPMHYGVDRNYLTQ
eukprot:TRINITY_DN6005_c0_g1_i3.p1 TRINITY_DN6005_c0_g1~~TRINITY_DN6005_c0_g1_i3.p1  ORF type:complete len:297 (-),score=1.12 TRINITY_DN6005_c0_g1_i3:578-1354(-)